MGACKLTVPGLEPGLLMHVHQHHDLHVSAQIREHGVWEPFETQLVLQCVEPGHVCVDVGANIGYFTVLSGQAVGAGGRVYAFEPEPGNLALLQRNIALNHMSDRCTVVAAGLAENECSADFFLSADNQGDHQLHPDNPAQSLDSISIQCLAGDDYFSSREVRVDFVKIDTQGAEYGVVAGLLKTLQSSGESLKLLVELTPHSLRMAGYSGAQLIALLATLRLPFFIVDHVEHRLVATSAEELSIWCNNVDDCSGDRGFMNILLGNL